MGFLIGYLSRGRSCFLVLLVMCTTLVQPIMLSCYCVGPVIFSSMIILFIHTNSMFSIVVPRLCRSKRNATINVTTGNSTKLITTSAVRSYFTFRILLVLLVR